MRSEFSNWIEAFGIREPQPVFLTGDLGFGSLESVRAAIGKRFVNMGVSEPVHPGGSGKIQGSEPALSSSGL
jgi:hypothetical protein